MRDLRIFQALFQNFIGLWVDNILRAYWVRPLILLDPPWNSLSFPRHTHFLGLTVFSRSFRLLKDLSRDIQEWRGLHKIFPGVGVDTISFVLRPHKLGMGVWILYLNKLLAKQRILTERLFYWLRNFFSLMNLRVELNDVFFVCVVELCAKLRFVNIMDSLCLFLPLSLLISFTLCGLAVLDRAQLRSVRCQRLALPLKLPSKRVWDRNILWQLLRCFRKIDLRWVPLQWFVFWLRLTVRFARPILSEDKHLLLQV